MEEQEHKCDHSDCDSDREELEDKIGTLESRISSLEDALVDARSFIDEEIPKRAQDVLSKINALL